MEIWDRWQKGEKSKSSCAMAKHWRSLCPHALRMPIKTAAIAVLTCATSQRPLSSSLVPPLHPTLLCFPSSPPLPSAPPPLSFLFLLPGDGEQLWT